MSTAPAIDKQPDERITLGVDPGIAIVGYAVVAARGSELRMIACDIITTTAGSPLPQRLQVIYKRLSEVIATYQPHEAAMEELFFAKNARTAITVGQARGVAMLAPAMTGIPVAEYAPNQVKKTVVGAGHADKNQIMVMLKVLLPKAEPKSSDAADALAIAITHAHHRTSAAMRLKVVGL